MKKEFTVSNFAQSLQMYALREFAFLHDNINNAPYMLTR